MDGMPLGQHAGPVALTAVAELLGCYLPMLWLSGKGSPWLLAPAGLSLISFLDPYAVCTPFLAHFIHRVYTGGRYF